MENFKAFLKKKDIEISAKRYGIDALGAMAQGLFCSLLIGTIINTIGSQFHIGFLTSPVATVAGTDYTVGGLASAMSGPAMATAIGYALHCPPLVLFSLITVGFASNALGGAGGPLAVLFVAIISAEIGKAVSKETKVDLLVTPMVTIGVGIALSAWWAPALGKAAMKAGDLIMWATELQPFLMGILVSLFVGIALTLPISSAAICAALGLTGLAGGAAVAGCCAQMVGFAVMSFPENKWGGLVSQGIGTSMLQIRLGQGRGGRHQGSHHRLRLDGPDPDLLHSPRSPLPPHQHGLQKTRLGERRRPEVKLKKCERRNKIRPFPGRMNMVLTVRSARRERRNKIRPFPGRILLLSYGRLRAFRRRPGCTAARRCPAAGSRSRGIRRRCRCFRRKRLSRSHRGVPVRCGTASSS